MAFVQAEARRLLFQYENKIRDIRIAQAKILDQFLGEGEGQFLRIGVWNCIESPVGVCLYNPSLDRVWDSCIFCHQPHERK